MECNTLNDMFLVQTFNMSGNQAMNVENNIIKNSNNDKLSKAIQLLSDSFLYISEIAYTLGYNDPRYFSRCFKQEFGLTPREFKESHQQYPTGNNIDHQFVNKATKQVFEKISIESFGTKQLANDLNVSYSNLYRKMKATTGLTPNEFIRKIRIRKAKAMMSDKLLSFTDIALSTGFCNVRYFSRCFKTEFGIYPSDYIESLKS